MRDLTRMLKNNGYQYYICGMVIWYGKGNYNRRMECNYVKEIGGVVDYKEGFQRIVQQENLSLLDHLNAEKGEKKYLDDAPGNWGNSSMELSAVRIDEKKLAKVLEDFDGEGTRLVVIGSCDELAHAIAEILKGHK